MKVLGISDSCNLYTGFGTQALMVMNGFQTKGVEVEQLGWWSKDEIVHKGIKIFGLMEGENGYGTLDKIIYHCNRFKPDIIFSLGDLHMIEPMFKAPDEIKKRWVHWLPIDAEPYPFMMHEALAAVPNLVLMADFAKKMSEKFLPNAHMIPHGLDFNVFKPLPNRVALRTKNKVEGEFVVVMVAKNQWRKCLDLAVEAFARFSRGKNDVRFIMHTQIMSPAKLRGWYIPHLVKLNTDDYDPELPRKIQVSSSQIHEKMLNSVYNVADVFFLTSAGEGFGIPSIEAQMAGVPIVIPDFTTGREFVLPDGKEENRTGELIKIATNMIQSDAGVKRALIDTQDAADKLEKMYRSWKSDKTLIRRYGENARRTSILKYDYNVVITQWYNLIIDIHRGIGGVNGDYQAQAMADTAVGDIDKPVVLEEI